MPPTSVERAFISLGSNVEPETYLPRAAARLAKLGTVAAISQAYQNPALGPDPAPDFVNAVAAVDTALTAFEIRDRLRAIEAALGRRRTQDRFAPRSVDLDLLLLGAQLLDDPRLTLPDPALLTDAHLAVPLAEIAPDLRHPLNGERMAAIAARLRDTSSLTPRPDVTEELRRAIE